VAKAFVGSNPTPRTIENVLAVTTLDAGFLDLLEGFECWQSSTS